MHNGQSSTIAVTGASGHLGACLVEMLAKQDYQVNAQFNNNRPPFEHENIRWIKGDINDQDHLSTLLSGCQAVVHAAGMISISDTDRPKLHNINVQGTQSVIDACLEIGNIRLIHISSSNAVIPPEDPNEPFDENRPYNDSGTPYAQSKAAAEKLVIKNTQSTSLDSIILRPSALIGPPDFKPSLMGGSIIDFYHGKYKFIPSGGYNCVDVRDVCQTIINTIEIGKTGEIYNTTGHFQSLKKLTDSIANLGNTKRPWFVISTSILFKLIPVMTIISKITGKPQRMTKNSLTTLKYGPRQMVCDKAKSELGHLPRSLEKTLNDLIPWYKKNGLIE